MHRSSTTRGNAETAPRGAEKSFGGLPAAQEASGAPLAGMPGAAPVERLLGRTGHRAGVPAESGLLRRRLPRGRPRIQALDIPRFENPPALARRLAAAARRLLEAAGDGSPGFVAAA